MRKAELDWLRVLVFSLLILYHVGMFFVPWGWHIKNDTIYPWLRYPMAFLSQWRLPTLFVISGMGTWYALARRSAGAFATERLRRLLIPLLFGIFFIVPPQVYIERIVKGQFLGGYFDFWPAKAFVGVYPEGNFSWHHLWFLPYLLFFSLALIPLLLYLRNHPLAGINRLIRRLSGSRWGLYLLIIPLYFWESLLEPFFKITHAFWGDWFNMINMMTFFLYGFLLLASGGQFWKTVQHNRRVYALIAVIAFGCLQVFWYQLEDSTPVHFTEAFFKVLNLWSWILAIFGYAATYLNKESPALRYANQAVYPFYILHQTITLILGYYCMHLNWGLLPKFLLMAVGTFSISWLLYEGLIRRIPMLRLLFGLKSSS